MLILLIILIIYYIEYKILIPVIIYIYKLLNILNKTNNYNEKYECTNIDYFDLEDFYPYFVFTNKLFRKIQLHDLRFIISYVINKLSEPTISDIIVEIKICELDFNKNFIRYKELCEPFIININESINNFNFDKIFWYDNISNNNNNSIIVLINVI
jgi:hypothetical protein